ncbi:MAG: DUF3108 domain-containing protein [Gammaproteobacteria bacterium]|nr:DUF3108 domain-containing protein [Gammaproteobacteria bacterium]
MKLAKLLTVFIPLIWSWSVTGNAQTINEYSLDFRASANGIAATAIRSLARTSADTFELANTLTASPGGQVIAKIEQVSTLQLTDSALRPLAYRYQQSGLSQAIQAINYNWEAMLAISADAEETWTIDLSNATYDQLSHQLFLRQALANNSTDLNFAVIDEDEIEIHRYRLIGKEIVATPLGNFNSTKVQRIRDEDDGRSTVFWLADDWDYLLVRMEQINSGLTILLELNNGVLSGEAIRPLD